MNDIPDFLDRRPLDRRGPKLNTLNDDDVGQVDIYQPAAKAAAPPVTTPPEPAPPATMPQPRKRKMDCFTRRIAIHIPISFQETDSLPNAIVALARLHEILPPDSMVETISEGFGKMPSEARR